MTDNLPETGAIQGATPTEPASQPVAQPTGETPEALREQLAKMQAALKEANKEAAARRKRLEELEAAEQQRQEANKTAEQRLADQLKKLEAERDAALAERKRAIITGAVTAQAVRLGFRDPADALAYLNPDALEVGEDGSVRDLETKLKALAESKPYLLAEQKPGVFAATNPQHGQAAGETPEQKRARIYAGGEVARLKGEFIPMKE